MSAVKVKIRFFHDDLIALDDAFSADLSNYDFIKSEALLSPKLGLLNILLIADFAVRAILKTYIAGVGKGSHR